MARISAWTALTGALALAGCYEVASDVPALTDDSRLTSLPMESGRYCLVGVEHGAAGALDLSPESDCFDVVVDGGAISVRTNDLSEPDVLSLELADLGRGLRLMQGYNIDGEGYQLMAVAMSEAGLAVLEDTSRTPAIDAAAEAAGVTLNGEASDIAIVSGEPGAVLGFMREATGLRLDAALRDESLRRDTIDMAMYYVRVAPDAADAGADEAATRAAVEGLAQRIDRAMALE
jgi:hypothetical protein